MNRPHRLTPLPVIGFLAVFLGLFVPLSFWMGWTDPSRFDLRGNYYPADWAGALTLATMGALFVVPIAWIAVGRTIDVVALQFLLNGLIILGYFFLDLTAPVIFGAEQVILTAGEQAVAVNAIGFFTLLAVLVAWYVVLSLRRPQLPPLPVPAAQLDRQLRWFLIPIVIVIGAMIALPMVLTRTVPMLSGDPMEGRMILERSNIGRPLYNLGSSLLPAIVASLLVLALRRKGLWKFINLEVAIAGCVVVIQFLSSNRLPIAITLLVFCALVSMEVKVPRWLLVIGVVGFISFYLGLSGFSSILRQNRDMLSSDNIVAASFREAFLGNNLSDLRDGAWVFGEWDYEPLNGKTYLGALAAFIPSALFPQKKEWYLGLVAIDIVHWPTSEHFGLRLSFFAESFLNFGVAGIIGLAVLMGSLFAYLLKKLHLSAAESPPCLTRNLGTLLRIQLVLTFANSSEGFVFWSLLFLLIGLWIVVHRPVGLRSRLEAAHAAGRLRPPQLGSA